MDALALNGTIKIIVHLFFSLVFRGHGHNEGFRPFPRCTGFPMLLLVPLIEAWRDKVTRGHCKRLEAA